MTKIRDHPKTILFTKIGSAYAEPQRRKKKVFRSGAGDKNEEKSSPFEHGGCQIEMVVACCFPGSQNNQKKNGKKIKTDDVLRKIEKEFTFAPKGLKKFTAQIL